MAAASARLAEADTYIVVPNANATTEGAGTNAIPFSDFGTSLRYQQVYAASQFGALSGPAWITAILLRPDAVYGHSFSATLTDIQIDLSTTSKAPDGLSPAFANNVGADDTVVFGRGALALSSQFTGPVGGPKDFDIVINLTTPFLYNPAAGNLLLDVRNYNSTISTTQMDAVDLVAGDPVSRVISHYGDGVNDATAYYVDSVGLVTDFRFAPAGVVPEPSAWLLLGTSLALSLGALKRKLAGR